MKTLVVLSALAIAAAAGSALSDDVTDFEVTKSVKRSPTFGKHHTVGIPVPVPVHQTYVQPVIPHHLGLKKPLLFHNHGHHLYREDEEQAEARSVEPKEIKNKCMKEMEAKCDDELIAKSSELDGTKIEDVDENISESEVVQSLQMAKEAVDTLQKKLQKAEKNSRMSQWKHGESESDLKLHENIATAKQALDHMQLNFGNLESMKVHATTFKDSGVQDVHLELGKSEQERLSQWKDAIENIQKNVELVKNIEDSFQSTEMRSASFEKSSNLKQANIGDHESSAGNIKLKEENDSNVKRASEMEVAEKVIENSDMESSASTLSEMKITHHSLNDHHGPSSRSDSSSSQPQSKHELSHHSNTAIEPLGVFPINNGKKMTLQGLQTDGDNEQSKNINDKLSNAKQMELALPLTKTIKSSEIEDTKLSHLDQGKSAPIVDTTALMKSADQHNNSQLNIDSNKDESDLKNTEATEPKLQMEHSRSSQLDSSMIMDQKSTDMSSSSIHNDNAHHMLMKSSDQMTGQSQHSEVVAKATQLQHSQHLEKSNHLNALGAHGKSAEGDSFSSQTSLTGLNAGFKSSLDVPKTMALKDASWKDGVSRSAYGSGAALGGGYGVGGGIGGGIGGGVGGGVGGGYGGGGAVGVFPSARVGGCAIPLLLSCSPSVVAGSLAKAHSSYAAPSYAAPAYRSTDTTNTHTKRDITKIVTPSKIKRTSNKNFKIKTDFDH